MKSFININVFILEDSHGEWWEYLKTDGSLRRFIPGTSNFSIDKKFPTVEKAIAEAKKREFKRFKVIRFTPPVKPSRTWGEEILFEQK